MRFEFIEAARQQHPQWRIGALCRILAVSRSGYAVGTSVNARRLLYASRRRRN